MDDFLKENGLKHAIPTFTYHVIEMNQLNELTEAHIKELLPAIGDRIRFREGRNVKNREIAVQTLKSHKKLTEKLRGSAIKLISDHVSLSFYFKYQNALKRWDVINFDNCSLNCPFCTRDIALRYRPNAEQFTWNICKLQRHLNDAHSNVAELKFRDDGDNNKTC